MNKVKVAVGDRITTKDYLDEEISYGGEPWRRGDAIRDMQKMGIPQRGIDAWMMGYDRTHGKRERKSDSQIMGGEKIHNIKVAQALVRLAKELTAGKEEHIRDNVVQAVGAVDNAFQQFNESTLPSEIGPKLKKVSEELRQIQKTILQDMGEW